MARSTPTKASGWNATATSGDQHAPLCDWLLRLVDIGILGVLLVAPFFFGGRHDFGRLVLVSLIALTAAAWFGRQAMLPEARWPRTIAHVILLAAAILVVFQIVPLPPQWIAHISPTAAELLPLWTDGSDDGARLGIWQTLSLAPGETTKSLAMLLSYSLFFIVVAGRIQVVEDVERLLRWVAVSAVVMALFGIAHYFTTDGRYFWFFAHPHRSATTNMSGAFINRNHFAHFLVLGLGPLVALLLRYAPSGKFTFPTAIHRPGKPGGPQWDTATTQQVAAWLIAAALAIVVFAILSSRSRGGAIAMLVAGSVLVAIYLYRGLVNSRFLLGLLGLTVAVIGLLSMHGYDRVVQRLDDIGEGSIEQMDHRGIRRELWAANIDAFRDLWRTGSGAGSHSDVYPIYLPQSYNKVYTHAENGYLQVASETGLGGIVLLATGIAVCCGWGASCLRHATEPNQVRLFGAAAAGLSASLAHSLVDFVWYIPACMSLTIVLAGCLMRLSQLVRPSGDSVNAARILPRSRWLELGTGAVMVGAWSIYVFVGPGVAAIHWDRYLRTSVENSTLSQKQLGQLVAGQPAMEFADREPLNDLMIYHLQRAVAWDPQFARAHLRLAAKYKLKFEWSQRSAENAIGLAQLRDAAMTSTFASQAELESWLERAFGGNIGWLRLAAAEARRAVGLCPLQGEGYISLADLCFLDCADSAIAESYVAQALRVRPYDADVLYAVGDLARQDGRIDEAVENWRNCFDDSGPHQLRIVFWLAGPLPASQFLEIFQPDWRTLRQVWSRYREFGRTQDTEALLHYAAAATRRETEGKRGVRPAFIWSWQAGLHRDVEQSDLALECLERAYLCDPTIYPIRNSLAKALADEGRFAEAEMHIRWCLARRPADRTLTNALVTITKQRLALRQPFQSSGNASRRPASTQP